MITINSRVLIIPVFFLGSVIAPLTFADEITSRLILNSVQQLSMGMQTEEAQQSKLIPSAVYPAEATIPLKTIRSISSPLSGEIITLNFVHGPIRKGQVIAEIESPELLKIQETYLATLHDLKISQQNLQRARKLNKSGVSSTKVLQQALSKTKKLSLNKSQHEKNLALLGMAPASIKNLEDRHELQPAVIEIKSPIDGQLFDLEVRLGERVSDNQNLISVGAINPMILVVRIPVEKVNDIKEAQKVELIGLQKIGVVAHIDAMVDPMTQSVDIHISVENNDHSLRSGQLFKIRFLSRSKDTVYRVSANAISQYNGQTIVFIQEQQGIKALPVQVVNISNKTLYFKAKAKHPVPLIIYSKGSTAIKSAMDAANESEQG